MKKSLLYVFNILISIFIISCSDSSNLIDKCNNSNETNFSQNIELNRDKYLSRFSEILSKAVYNKKVVRDFLKAQALKKIDNGYNIFYPIAKDEKVSGNTSFKDILTEYAKNKEELESIEKAVPLLNIHIPEFENTELKVENIKTEDNEIPILFSNSLYFNGEKVDSIKSDEIPNFSLFVVCESSSIRKKDINSRSVSANSSLKGKYEFVDNSFNPSAITSIKTRTIENEYLSEKYSDKGYVPSEDIDPTLIEAYKNSNNTPRATRYLMYYGLKNQNETPTSIRPDVKDCIFRFKIAGDAFSRLEDIATGHNANPFFYNSVSNKKSSLSREEVLKRILTGQAFCFLFRIEGSINGQNVTSEGMKVYVTPEKLFSLNFNESKRGSNFFRHSKYTYTINKSDIKEKWFYPLDYGNDTRLNEWNIAKDPVNKRIVVYLINPNEGYTKEITETYSLTYVSQKEAGGNISIPIDKITLGINGKLDNTTTEVKTVTTKYTITESNERIDEFYFDFFDDYPIESILSSNNYIVPMRKGKGIIETSILPISNNFFAIGRFKNK